MLQQRTIILLVLLATLIHGQCRQAPFDLGATCSEDADCASAFCENKKCSTINLVSTSQVCDGDYRCFINPSFCAARSKICSPGLWCKGLQGTMQGSCTSMVGAGGNCGTGEDYECRGSFCHNSTKTCTVWFGLDKDQPCRSTTECQKAYSCSPKTCVTRAKLGEDCNTVLCVDGTYCNSNTKKCDASKKTGESCVGAFNVCESTALCDSSTCVNFFSKSENQVCSSSYECASGLSCKKGKCFKPGTNCTADGCPFMMQQCECPVPGTCKGVTTNQYVYEAVYTSAAVTRQHSCLLAKYRAYPNQVVVDLLCAAPAAKAVANIVLFVLAMVFIALVQ